jgi:hypothetical protein
LQPLLLQLLLAAVVDGQALVLDLWALYQPRQQQPQVVVLVAEVVDMWTRMIFNNLIVGCI